MKLIDNWKAVLLKAWSAYGLYALVILGLINDYLIPYLQGAGHLGPGFGTVVTVVASVTLGLRIFQQVALLIPPSKPDA